METSEGFDIILSTCGSHGTRTPWSRTGSARGGARLQ